MTNISTQLNHEAAMKVTFPITAFFLAGAANAGKSALRKEGGGQSNVLPPTHDDRELWHEEIKASTSVVDLCDYHPEYKVFDPLPVTVTAGEETLGGEPDKVFKIENAAGITFTFSTCDITDEDTTITIWDGIDTGDWNYVTYNDDSCGLQSKLTWNVPDNSIYYVKFGDYNNQPYFLNVTWSTDVDWDYCFSPTSKPSSMPSTKPSSKPSTVPTSKPSSFPSSQPTHPSCEMVNPCDYDMEDDGMGGVNVIDTYYPVCVRQDTKKKSYYRQECYPESVIAGLGAGDVDPEHDDRMIVNCGCCPSDDDMLPADIEKVKGNTDVCDGGLDCLAEAASVSISKSGKKTYFQMCIDGDDDHWEQNFYVPSDDETASCGQCDLGDIIV